MIKEIAIAVGIAGAIFAAGLGSYFLLVAYIVADWWWVQHSVAWAFDGAWLARLIAVFGAVMALLLTICAACAAFDAR